MRLVGDSVLVVGLSTADGRSPYLLECLKADTSYLMDTVASGLDGLDMTFIASQNRILFAYGRNGDLFGRILNPDLGLGQEFAVCNAPQEQTDLQLVVGSGGVGLAWTDLRQGSDLFIQHYREDLWQWPNGRLLAHIAISPRSQFDACDGSDYGLVAYQSITVQPLDSLPLSIMPGRETPRPQTIQLDEPCPNPFNGETMLQFTLPEPTEVRLSVYNILGQEVNVLITGYLPAGKNQQRWQTDLSSGLYLLCLKTTDGIKVRKLFVLR
jgi:hypothetical protein